MVGGVHVRARVRHEVQDFHVGHVASGLREHGLEARVGETREDRDARPQGLGQVDHPRGASQGMDKGIQRGLVTGGIHGVGILSL